MGVVATMTLTTSDQASAASPQPLAAPTAPPAQVPHERSEAAATQRPAPLPPSLWDDPRIEEALANRDIATIFKFLQTLGISQRTIARYTAQSQSEISEVLAGRTVARYDVLVRIAIGLGIPRGRLGLAYDDPQHHRDFTQQGRPIPRAVTPTTTTEPVVTTQVDRCELCQFAKATARTPRPATPAKRPTATDKMIAAISEKQAPIARTHLSAAHTPGVPLIRTVAMWTGLQIRALREAKRMSVRQFATYLGVSDRMVSKWEAGGVGLRPRPVNQEALDTALKQLNSEERARLTEILRTIYAHLAPDDDAPKNEPTRDDAGDIA